MKIGVVRYPGTNCFYDTINYFGEDNCIEIWHKNDKIPEIDLLIIPGGFAFGDRYYQNATDNKYDYSPGKMAVDSPVTSIIRNINKKNIPILGICNGFQILIHLGLLPGELIENKNKLFMSKSVELSYEFNELKGKTNMYIANYYGNYQNNKIKDNDIFLKYNDIDNGSYNSIAGIMNKEKNVFGMMPHPERMIDEIISNKDGVNLFSSLLN